MKTAKTLQLNKETLRLLSPDDQSGIQGGGPTTFTVRPVCRRESDLIACSQDTCYSAVFIDGGCLNETQACL